MSTRSISSRQRQCWPLLLALCLLACAASASIENPSLETVARRLSDSAAPSVAPADKKQPGDNPGDGEKNSDKAGEGNSKPPGDDGDTEQVDGCAKAGTNCQACDAAKDALDDEENTCAYQIDQGGIADGLLCQKVKKSDVANPEANMCSGTNNPEDVKTAAPGDPALNNNPSPQPEEEGGGSGALFLIVGLVVVGGGLYVAKTKMSAKGPPGSSPAKHGKYESVAAASEELETDDWDDWGEGGDGDVEMQPSFKDDTSLTRRASSDKSDDDDFGWGGSPVKPTPQFVPKRSPRVSSHKMKGAEGTSPPPVPKPPFSGGRLPTAPDSIPQRITSLGEKKQKPTPKKPERKQEDDIFASMGLSAKPKFTPAPKPTSGPSPLATGGSRWAQTTATTMTTPSTNFGAAELKATASMDDDDDNWDDDGDLDDLLDD